MLSKERTSFLCAIGPAIFFFWFFGNAESQSNALRIDSLGGLSYSKNGKTIWKNHKNKYDLLTLSYFTNENKKLVSGFIINKYVVALSHDNLYYINKNDGSIFAKKSLNMVPTGIIISDKNLLIYRIDKLRFTEVQSFTFEGVPHWRENILVPSGDKNKMIINTISKDKITLRTSWLINDHSFSYESLFNIKNGSFMSGDQPVDGFIFNMSQTNGRFYIPGEPWSVKWLTLDKTFSGTLLLSDIEDSTDKGEPCFVGPIIKSFIKNNEINILFTDLTR